MCDPKESAFNLKVVRVYFFFFSFSSHDDDGTKKKRRSPSPSLSFLEVKKTVKLG